MGLTVVTVVFLLVQMWFFHSHMNSKRGFQWGLPFQGYPLQSFNIKMDCEYNGFPVCCAILQGKKSFSSSKQTPVSQENIKGCTVKKAYLPSPYELRHISFAKETSLVEDEEQRKRMLSEFIYNDVSLSKLWLNRVSTHMSAIENTHAISLSEHDMEYLSRYRVSRYCEDSNGIEREEETWYEWIEPLSIHTRHPYGIANCSDSDMYVYHNDTLDTSIYEYNSSVVAIDRADYTLMNVDYVLLQHDNDIEKADNKKKNGQRSIQRYFFDVGTSTFNSSLSWFLCAYSNRGVSFDAIYGWEATLLEPKSFWDSVPPSIIPYYHYFNAPISDKLSPIHILQQVARKEDYVSLKLDIDTPSLEIPLILEIISNPSYSSLIDELFFELHFRCEYLMYCGWTENIPTRLEGLVLDRYNTLVLFQQLRQLGIRAHFWP